MLSVIVHEGVEKSVAHLAPIEIVCPCPDMGRDLRIRVTFNNHCYTEAFDETLHDRAQILGYDAPDRPRVFCAIRHGLSFRLPEVLRNLPTQKVHQTSQQRNYVHMIALEVAGEYYNVFFMLQRAEKRDGVDLRLTVESAYLTTGPLTLPKRPGSIRFSVLA